MDGELTWIHSDHLHSATILTDEDGREIRRLAYRAFGEELENTGSGTAPKYSYTGKERDASGLMYYGARYYDPALSRFITADTVYDAGPQGLNRYSYALNNPIRYNDPSGHFSLGSMFGNWDWPGAELVGAKMQAEAQGAAEAVTNQITPPEQDTGVLEGSIPIWGDGKDAYLAFKEGKIGYAALYGAMAINDIVDGGVSPEDGAKAAVRGGKEVAEKLVKEGPERYSKKIIPGIDRPFRSANPSHPPHKQVTATMQSMKIEYNDDCGDIAEILLRASGGDGEILRVTPAQKGQLHLYEYGRLTEPMVYHEVYTDGRYVYDPRLHPEPVPKGDWQRMMFDLNPDAKMERLSVE